MKIFADQPGSEPIEVPFMVPNPAFIPDIPDPKIPLPTPVKEPVKEPA